MSWKGRRSQSAMVESAKDINLSSLESAVFSAYRIKQEAAMRHLDWIEA